jgi:hypothetical protein
MPLVKDSEHRGQHDAITDPDGQEPGPAPSQRDGYRGDEESLEYEAEAYEKLGRLEKANAVRKWLTSRSQ